MPTRSIDAQTLQFAAGLVSGSREVVALVAYDGSAALLNPDAVGDVLGYVPARAAREWLEELIHPEDVPLVVDTWRSLLQDSGGRASVRWRARHKTGSWVQLESTGTRFGSLPQLRAVVVHTRPVQLAEAPLDDSVSDQWDLRDQAAFARAVRDAVTTKLRRVWQASQGGQPAVKDRRFDFTLMLVELDRFKMLVGSHGQQVADAVVDEIGRRLRGALDRADLVGYLGGGEFGVLVRGSSEPEQATKLADRVSDVVGEGIRLSGHTVSCAAIIGIATSERRYERADELMSDAAAALNRARKDQRKRRRAAFDTRIRLEDRQFITMLTDLHEALKRDQFLLDYQPIISLRNGKLEGFEALVRWRHAERGIVPPGQFIPVAEQTGFIGDLGQWVLREACRQMRVWQDAFPHARRLNISVNLSAEQLGEEILPLVETILRDTGLPPERLRLEVTESALIKNSDAASRALAMLRLYGVGLSLDDFGTGYGSFSYLHQLPFDSLKIDRSFVARLTTGDEDTDASEADIITAMINLAHALRLGVVAEGVETSVQAEMLQAMNCDYAQGFFFARPLDPNVAGELLASDPVF